MNDEVNNQRRTFFDANSIGRFPTKIVRWSRCCDVSSFGTCLALGVRTFLFFFVSDSWTNLVGSPSSSLPEPSLSSDLGSAEAVNFPLRYVFSSPSSSSSESTSFSLPFAFALLFFSDFFPPAFLDFARVAVALGDLAGFSSPIGLVRLEGTSSEASFSTGNLRFLAESVEGPATA